MYAARGAHPLAPSPHHFITLSPDPSSHLLLIPVVQRALREALFCCCVETLCMAAGVIPSEAAMQALQMQCVQKFDT